MRSPEAEMGEEGFQALDTFVELTVQQRQSRCDPDNMAFKQVLNNMRLGITSPEIENFLNSKIYDNTENDIIQALPPKKTLFVAPTRATVKKINMEKTKELVNVHKQECMHIWSHDTMDANKKKSGQSCVSTDHTTNRMKWWKIDPDQGSKSFNKLAPVLNLCIGSRVMTTSNLATNLGICNGSLGTVVGFMYHDGHVDHLRDCETKEDAAENLQPLPVVLVEFDDLPPYATSYYVDKPNIIPISPSTCNLAKNVIRKQLPLALSFCSTIHKAQGSSVDNVVCMLEPCHSRGLLYVAASRVRSVEGLHFVMTAKKFSIVSSDITGQPQQKRKNNDTGPYQIIQNVYDKLRGEMYNHAMCVAPLIADSDGDPLDVFTNDPSFEIILWQYGLQENHDVARPHTETQICTTQCARQPAALVQQKTLFQALNELETIFNNGMDSNGSHNSCCFLSIYGVHSTRKECCLRLLELPVTDEIVKCAQQSLTNALIEQENNPNNILYTWCQQQHQETIELYTLWESLKKRKNEKTQEINALKEIIVPKLVPFWSDEDRINANGEVRPATSVLGSFASIVEKFGEEHSYLFDLQDRYENLQNEYNSLCLFQHYETRSTQCMKMYIALLSTNGYQCSDEDLNIISLLENMTIVRVNKDDTSHVEPMTMFNKKQCLQQTPTRQSIMSIKFIAYANEHYEEIINVHEYLEDNQIEQVGNVQMWQLV